VLQISTDYRLQNGPKRGVYLEIYLEVSLFTTYRSVRADLHYFGHPDQGVSGMVA
jgi:hypothetical protein